MSVSGNPYQPLQETIYKMERTLEIYEARLSNGALVIDDQNKEIALHNMRYAITGFQEAFVLLFGKPYDMK